MSKKIIPSNVPFPLSKAIVYHNEQVMEISGQIGTDPKTGKLLEGIEKQTQQSLENVKSVLKETGWDTKDVVKVRIYLTKMEDYSKVNEIYSQYFKKDFPARVVVAVNELPAKALIEIECVASRPTL